MIQWVILNQQRKVVKFLRKWGWGLGIGNLGLGK
jgi:hypothetical protein